MKLNKSQLSIGILFLSLSVVGILFAFSKLTPSASPSSTYHSLNDIYTLITAGTEKATPNSALTTSSSPSATTSHSTTEIYLLLANKFSPSNLRPGTNIFGITGAFGTTTAPYEYATSSAVSSSLTPTYTTDTLPTYTLEDIYSLINDSGTRITTPNHTFSSSPSASMHTTTQIYERLAGLKTYLTSTKFGTSTSIFGVTGSFEPVAQLNEGCGSNDECFTGWCDYNWYGICTNGAVGDSCGTGDSCASGYCDYMNSGTCTDGSVGSGCGSDSDCASGKCAFDEENWYFFQCTDGLAGSICYNNADCSSPNTCDTGTYTCVDSSNGAACTSSLGCSSGHCYGDVCTAGTTAVDGCDSSDDCESGYCDSINSICSSGAPGSVCGGNSECDTYNCVSNVCSADLPPLASGLIGYWPFEETTGTTTADLSGNGHNGTLLNGVVVNQTGKVGKAFSFDGTNDIINLGNLDSLLVGKTVITYSVWAKLDTYANRAVLTNTLDNYANTEFTITSTNMSFCINTGGSPSGWCPANTNQTVNLNSWHLFTVVYNGSSITPYVDGVSLGSFSVNGLTIRQNNTAKDFIVGGRSIDTYVKRWDGMIDEVAIWNRPLAPAEITSLYNSGNGVVLIP